MSCTFCPLPWMSMSVRNNGDFRVCCHANASSGRGIAKSESGKVLNAADTPIEAARNSALLKKIRQEMLAGQWPESCLRCQTEEQSGIRSRRVFENQIWGDRFNVAWAERSTDPSGQIDVEAAPLAYIDVRFGNRCNLKCRMCGPTDSNSWYQDHTSLFGPSFLDTHGKVEIQFSEEGIASTPNQYTWFESEVFWESLKSRINEIEKIHSVGGEPLMIPQHYTLLEELVNSGRAPFVCLDYNSNLTLLNDRILKLWEHFKEVRVAVSIDGFGPHNDYIRHPSRWSQVSTNLAKLNTATGQFDLFYALTVQAFNIYYLPEFAKWSMQSGLKKFNRWPLLPLFTPHLLHNPSYYNIQILPLPVKRKVQDRLQKFSLEIESLALAAGHSAKRAKAMFDSWNRIVSSYCDFMLSADLSHDLDKFWKITRRLDALRGESFASTFPEFYSLLEPHLEIQGEKSSLIASER